MKVRCLLALTAAAIGFAQMRGGIDPLPSATDYPADAANSALAIGAGYVSGAEQRRIFGRDWSASHVFLEVGTYPQAGQLSISPQDFVLRASGESIRAVNADVIMPYPKTRDVQVPDSNAPVHVRTVDTIGYEHGPGPYKGVYTDTQVQVAVGNTPTPAPQPPIPSDPAAQTRIDLTDKELPDAKSAAPVAGFLYFPKPKHPPKDGVYELAYYGASGDLKLKVETKKKR